MAHKSRNAADSMVNIIIAVILIAVIGLAGYTIYGQMSSKINKKAIENGEKEATVEYLAEQDNMSVEDYLAQYGLSGVSKNATKTEMEDQMTVDDYLSYSGMAMEDFTTQYHMSEAPAGDTIFGELRKSFTVRNMIGDGEDEFNQFKQIYGIEDGAITLDTLWTDAEPIIQESIQRMQEEAANATPAPATEAPAEESAEATPEAAENE